jgi:predicted Zn-dependent peptidase
MRRKLEALTFDQIVALAEELFSPERSLMVTLIP